MYNSVLECLQHDKKCQKHKNREHIEKNTAKTPKEDYRSGWRYKNEE